MQTTMTTKKKLLGLLAAVAALALPAFAWAGIKAASGCGGCCWF